MEAWRKPLYPPQTKPIRWTIHVLVERCKGCNFCIEFCPRKVLEVSPEFNTKGYHSPFPKNIEACIGCGLCQELCPDFAIFPEKEDERE